MVLRWFERRRVAAARVSARVAADAEALMQEFGDAAYGEARRRAVDTLSHKAKNAHWNRVRREIGRRTGRAQIDTATRYLEP